MSPRKPRRPATSLEQIARLANVSTTTVSLVLNGKAEQYRISARTRDKVVALAKELKYSPNPTARSLRLKRSHTIGLVISDLSNYFFTQLARHLEQICREHGYLLQVSASEDNDVLEEEIVENFISRSVDGLIIASVHKDSKFLSNLHASIPTVFIDRRLEDGHCSWVESDNYESACKLVDHLAGSKPREIAYIGGIEYISSNMERLRAYKDVLKRHRIRLNRKLILERDFTIESGYQSMAKLMESLGRLPDALFTASYTLLEGALTALKEEYDLSTVDMKIGTFDNHPLLEFAALRIHSVEQNSAAIAGKSFEILSNHLKGKDVFTRETVPARVIIRE